MGDGRYAVAVLYHGGNGHRPGTSAQADSFQRSVGLFAEHVFAVVGRYVDMARVELAQSVNDAEYLIDTVAFQRRKNLERE